jgi:hypothetical protein
VREKEPAGALEAILVSRLEIVLGMDTFSENEDVPFHVNLREFIRFYENAVQ